MTWFNTGEYLPGMHKVRPTSDGMPVHEMFMVLGQMMPAWEKTPVGTRQTLLQILIYPASVVARGTVPGVEALVAAKWLDADWKKSEIRRGKAGGPVWDLLRAMNVHERLPNDIYINHLLTRLFSSDQVAQLDMIDGHHLQRQQVESSARSRIWVDGFLAAADKATWMKQMHLRGPLRSPMDNPAVFGNVQKLVKICLEQSRTLRVESMAEHIDFGGREAFYRLLGLAVEHLLLIPVLDSKTQDLLVMIEPAAHESLRRPAVVRPVPVAAAAEMFGCPWMVEDIIVVLTQTAFKPLRMRTDGEIYSQDMSDLAAALMPLPEWLRSAESYFADRPSYVPQDIWRAEFAVRLALRSKFIDHGVDNSWRDLKPTAKGQEFLRLSPQQRVRHLADAMIASQARGAFQVNDLFRKPFGGLTIPKGKKSRLGDLRPVIAQAVDAYPSQSYIPADQFLWYQATKENPYIAEAKDKVIWNELNYAYRSIGMPATQPEVWENLWINSLRSVLFHYVAGMGGVTFGRDRDGQDVVYFQVNTIGRYLLGLTAEFVYDQPQIASEKPLLVQPNFDLVFVAAAPAVYVLCGQFCERSGKGAVGNVLKITKKSIVRAASAGWTVERVVETLTNASSKPLPANVVHEIRGWFGGVRHVQAHHCVLITCPDAGTADRVMAFYARTESGARILSGHMVELPGSLSIAEITRTLHKAGIFITQPQGPSRDRC